MQVLRTFPSQGAPFLIKRLQPTKAADPHRLQQLIKALGDEQFSLRERALRELQTLGELAEPALRRSLDRDTPLESRRRIELLLGKLPRRTAKSPEHLRSFAASRSWSGSVAQRRSRD